MDEPTAFPYPDDPRSDAELLRACVADDAIALRTLYTRHARWIAIRLRRSMTATATEDILQETFLAVWTGARSYRGAGDVGGWMWGIARRQAALWARRNGRPVVDLDLLAGEPVTARDDPASDAIRRIDIERAFVAAGDLGTPGRELAHKAFFEERTMAELATDFRVPAGTVKSRLHALRRAMRRAAGGETR